MALVASSISGAAYNFSNQDDRETGNGFEFTRRKKWPQLLLQELVGSALFCLKPIPEQRNSMDGNNGSSSGSSGSRGSGWKMIFVSPSVNDMLGQKVGELEGKDFLDLVLGPDQPHLQTLFTSLLTPPPLTHGDSSSSSSSGITPNLQPQPLPHQPAYPDQQNLNGSSKSKTAYIRMIHPNESKPVTWEIRAHATGLDGSDSGGGFGGGFGLGLAGSGTVVPRGNGDEGVKGRAVWVMGRKVEGAGEGEGNAQSLDAFLELKLENEHLREELRELQIDLDEEDTSRSYTYDPSPTKPLLPPYLPTSPSTPSTSSSSPSSNSRSLSPIVISKPIKPKPGRPPKAKDPAKEREKKRLKKEAMADGVGTGGEGSGGGGGGGEGLHVCVTCGRTDSPEWRKGPLGPKTLCNACGLRWAKRNSTAPSRKEKKAALEAKKG